MRRPVLLSSILCLSIFLLTCELEPLKKSNAAPLPGLAIPWTSNQSIVCYGTSLTYGFIWRRSVTGPYGNADLLAKPVFPPSEPSHNAVDSWPEYSYPYQLGLTLKIQVYNVGMVGAKTDRALSVLRDSVLSKNPALVLLEFTANDLLQGVSDSLARIRLCQIVDTLQSAGTSVVLVSFLNSEMINSIPEGHYLSDQKEMGLAYLEMMRSVAFQHSIQFVEYAMDGIYWNADLMSDALHPNEEGYKVMQENISFCLSKTFARSGMLR